MLRKANARYEQVTSKYAPRNPRLWSEMAATQASLATARANGGQPNIVTDKTFLDKAVASAEMAVKLDPKYDFSLTMLADIYRLASRPDDAGETYLALAELDPLQLANDE